MVLNHFITNSDCAATFYNDISSSTHTITASLISVHVTVA